MPEFEGVCSSRDHEGSWIGSKSLTKLEPFLALASLRKTTRDHVCAAPTMLPSPKVSKMSAANIMFILIPTYES